VQIIVTVVNYGCKLLITLAEGGSVRSLSGWRDGHSLFSDKKQAAKLEDLATHQLLSAIYTSDHAVGYYCRHWYCHFKKIENILQELHCQTVLCMRIPALKVRVHWRRFFAKLPATSLLGDAKQVKNDPICVASTE